MPDPGGTIQRGFAQRALSYYIVGRFAMLQTLRPEVSGPLLHHAIEHLLKACITGDGGSHRNSHRLDSLWQTASRTWPNREDPALRRALADLERFEELRHPDETAQPTAADSPEDPDTIGGTAIMFIPGERGEAGAFGGKEPPYMLVLDEIDALFAAILSSASLWIFAGLPLGIEAQRALMSRNRHGAWARQLAPDTDAS